MSRWRKRQLVMDAETGLVGEVERVSRRLVTVVFPNAEEFLSRQIGFSRPSASERLIRRKPGQRRFPEWKSSAPCE